MARHRSRALLLLIFVATLVLTTSAAGTASVVPVSAAQQPGEPLPDGDFVARIYYDTVEDIKRLHAFDVFEYNNPEEKYFLATVDGTAYRELQALGFRVQVDVQETANLNRQRVVVPNQVEGIPGYACYRTVEETFASAQAIVAAHPNLAAWIDVGDSWEKATAGGLPGYDMMVLRLTNSAISGPKPKLFVTAAIHAREYAPAELVTRFAEYLVDNYGIDADATWLLDWHEVHVMPQADPDGRKQAEGGLLWRKNTNNNYCSNTNNRGADLNRNFSFQWNCCGGSSSNVCDPTYRGPTAGSEPEMQAIHNYTAAIFPDLRDPQLTAAAPATAPGVYMDVHSAANLVLWPWGMTTALAPNSTALQTLGRKFAYFNGYRPEQSVGLYPTDGATDDHVYGTLGVAAYTVELGGQFFQPCDSFLSSDLSGNLPMLLYAAKAARTPYQTPAGPDALNVAVTPGTVSAGAPVVLTATINDTRYNNSNGAEPTQSIAAAEYYVDVPPWDTPNNPVAIAMSPSDGIFNSTIEGATATVNTGCLAPGKHMIFVRGRDVNNNWGAFSAIFLNVTEPVAAGFTSCLVPAAQPVCAPASAQYQINIDAWSGFTGPVALSTSGLPLGATASFSANPVNAPGASSLTIDNTASVAAGSYSFTISASGSTGTHSSTAQLIVYPSALAAPTLAAPVDGNTGIATTTGFTWSAVTGAASYDIQVAADPTFSSIVAGATGLTSTSYTPPSGTLALNTVYYWRVQAMRPTNACNGLWSAVAAFRTAAIANNTSCYVVTSNDVAKAVPYNSFVDSVISFPQAFTISDVNVKIDRILHPSVADLDVYLLHPDSTLIELSTDNGSTGDHYTNTIFDDAATNVIGTSGNNTAPFTGTYRPEGVLASLNNKTSFGAWKLHVLDDSNTTNTAGTIQSWSLTLCGSVTATTADFSDLASSYGAAWHTGGGALRLGPTWTADTSFAAGADVDDGVSFIGNFTAGQNATVRVNVQGTPVSGRWLRLWFDWNYNGVFDGDELVHNGSVAGGDNDLTVAVPAGLSSAVKYRARLYDSASAPTASDAIDSASHGAAAGGEVEDDLSPTPLAVTLAEFYAQQISDYVLLTWETASELDNRGFNLYRGTSPDGWDRQLNTALIPSQSQGNPNGFVYTWEDRADLTPGTTYYYWLQDVDLSGAMTMHGPVSVDFSVPTAVTLGGMQASPAGPAALPLAGTALALLASLAGALAVRRRDA